MNKRTIYLLIPLLVIAGYQIYSWIEIISTPTIAIWRHYTGFFGASLLAFLLFIDQKKCLIAMGAYLLIGVGMGLSLTPAIERTYFGFGDLVTGFNSLSLGIFILYVILNFGAFVDLYDEANAKRSAT